MSDEVSIDFTNYKDRVGSRVAPGRYRVVVDDAELDQAKSGNTMINLWLRIVEGEYVGSVIIDRLVITEKSLFRVAGFMQAIGITVQKKRFKVNLRQWVGRQLEIDLEDGEPYNGRVKSEVRGYMKAPGRPGQQQKDLDLDDLDEVPGNGAQGKATEDEADADMGTVDLDSLNL